MTKPQAAAAARFVQKYKDRFAYIDGCWHVYSEGAGNWELDQLDLVFAAVRDAYPAHGIGWYNAVIRVAKKALTRPGRRARIQYN